MEKAIPNSKHETRNSKQIQMSQLGERFLFIGFENLDFEFVSDFDIRISDFSISEPGWVPAVAEQNLPLEGIGFLKDWHWRKGGRHGISG